MRYYYKKPLMYSSIYGSTYKCNHPVYNDGLAIVQQRYNPETKETY